MNLQSFIDNAMAEARAKSLANSDQFTLGKLISELEPIVAKQKERKDSGREEAEVVYDFCRLFPSSIDSWRGSYNELALNHNEHGDKMTVTDFLSMLNDTVGKTFDGYKGGEFTMRNNTPLWVANYGSAGNTAIVGVIDNGYEVILVTGYREF